MNATISQSAPDAARALVLSLTDYGPCGFASGTVHLGLVDEDEVDRFVELLRPHFAKLETSCRCSQVTGWRVTYFGTGFKG